MPMNRDTSQSPGEVIAYKRGRFATRLPVSRRYTLSHFWLREEEPGAWPVGFPKGAAGMLGELAEQECSRTARAAGLVGLSFGSVEGFRVARELYSVAAGDELGTSPA